MYVRPKDALILCLQPIIVEQRGKASNRDELSYPVCIYVCIIIMYIRPSQPETTRLHNSPVFSAGAHLATIGHKSAQHSTSSLHAAFRVLLMSLMAPVRATRLLAIPPYWLTSFAPRGREHFQEVQNVHCG